MSFKLSNNFNDDMIDVRDIIERVEDLRGGRDIWVQDYLDYCEAKGRLDEWDEGEAKWAIRRPDEARELLVLENFLSGLKGYGGDEQWEGDWYPVTLVNEDYFTEYAQEVAGEVVDWAIHDAVWPYNCIDWEQVANGLKHDYSTVDLKPLEEGGEVATYYYRG